MVSVSIAVKPLDLESLLEVLAQVSFPINPQIFHDARMVMVYADQHEESEATTLVEFPAYASQLEEVRRAIDAFGFDPECVQVISMLDEIHAEHPSEPAPRGAPYVRRYRLKSKPAAAAH